MRLQGELSELVAWRQKEQDDEAKLQEYEMDDESDEQQSNPPYSDIDDDEQAYSGEYGHGPPSKTCRHREVQDLT